MATSEFHGTDEDINVERLLKWPLEYAPETKEYTCGWCGQLLISNHSHNDLQTHFQSCKSSETTGLLKVEIKAEMSEDTEIGKDMGKAKTKVNKEISDIKKNLETEIKSREMRDAVLFNRFNTLEEKMREMGADQEKKLADVSGRVSGVTETITSVVQSLVEECLKRETETLWVELRKSTGDLKSPKTNLEAEIALLKTGAETLLERMETNDRDLRIVKRQMEDEASQQSAKKTCLQVAPSPINQMTIRMNCFNLAANNYLFQPSYRWTINGIKAKLSRGTFELTSKMFQCAGYPVQARAKLQLKANGYVYVSLDLNPNEALQSESRAAKLIPQVFYLLKNFNSNNLEHKCTNTGYLYTGTSSFTYSLKFETHLCCKSWLKDSRYNVKNSIEVKIYVEPPLMIQHVHSYDGTLEWKIENYARKLHFEKQGLVRYQESPYFYTGPNGYKIQVNLYLNGVKGGSGPTAYILFRTGKFDDRLQPSFPHSTTVTLVDPTDPEKNINKTIVEDIPSKKYYDFEICTFKEMKNVVENNTLFCRVVIKAHLNLSRSTSCAYLSRFKV